MTKHYNINSHGRFRAHKALGIVLMCLLPALLAGCSDDDFNKVIPDFLQTVKSQSPEENARMMFNPDDPDARRVAIAYFSKQRYGHIEVYMKAYKLLATDPDQMVRGQALLALGSSRDPSVAPYLIKGLDYPSAQVRIDAARALQIVTNSDAVPALLNHLKTDTDDMVRMNCAQALQPYKSAVVQSALIDALDDNNVGVCYFAWVSLYRQTGKRYIAEPEQWREWFNEEYPNFVAPA